jgi:hypothetical protein
MSVKEHEQRSRRRLTVTWLARTSLLVGAVLVAAPGADAWDAATSTEAQPCQWSPVVGVGFQCTGAYVGNRMVLTAAHCLFELAGGVIVRKTLNQLSVRFGERENEPQFVLDVTSCVEHPDAQPDISPMGDFTLYGTDLAYCVLVEDPPVPVPVISPMVPKGCARDWLSHSLWGVAPGRPLAMALGMGCEDQACVNEGTKRFTGVELQPSFLNKQFVITRFLDPNGVGLRGGDSGGPLYVKLPDHTWRLIGVNQSTAYGDTADVESVPPYLAWIEWRSGVDITPCHTRTPGTSDYVFTGGCEGMLPLDPGSAQAEWGDGCDVLLGGPSDAALDECAEWPVGPTTTFLAPSL